MRLILLRHAKSEWGDAGQEDVDRVLAQRGRRDAPRIGDWLRALGDAPDRILVSAAARTRETWALTGLDGAPEFREDLYLATPGTILSVLPAEGCVLVLGHNPGLGVAAMRFAADPPDDEDFRRFPTCACAVLDFDGPPVWREGRLAAFTTPRRLPMD